MKNRHILCAFDLDNTLYDFIGFFGPAFRGMISAISKKTDISKDALTHSAAEVIAERGFLEYAFLIREMSVFQGYGSDEISLLEKLAQGAFGRVRKKRLVAYPQVSDMLLALVSGGVTVAAVTNAPIFQAYRRLESLRLLKHFDSIVACENTAIPDYVSLRGKREPWSGNTNIKLFQFERGLGKPSAHPYELLKESYENEYDWWVVGDNIERDLKPADSVGYTTVWARYGCDVVARDYDTVLRLTPTNVKLHELAKSEYTPHHTVVEPIEVLQCVPYAAQYELFSS